MRPAGSHDAIGSVESAGRLDRVGLWNVEIVDGACIFVKGELFGCCVGGSVVGLKKERCFLEGFEGIGARVFIYLRCGRDTSVVLSEIDYIAMNSIC